MKKNVKADGWQAAAHVVLALFSLAAVIPFILLVIASFTDNQWALANGISFFPKEWSLTAYEYILNEWGTIGRAYLMTIVVTLIGTVLSILLTTSLAYALTDKDLPGVKILTFLCVFTMLFNGGIVASFYIWVKVFHIRNTLWALIFPNLMMSAFNIILVKNYYNSSIPDSLKEAARIDGAGEFKIFTSIVFPLSKPIIATIGLMTAITYWNDWTNGLYYLTERGGSQYYTIQIVLNTINDNINFLASHAGEAGSISTADIPSTTVRMAIAVVGVIPILIAYPFFQKYFVKGITMGGVKE